MSYNDSYGSEPRRSNRRTPHEPAGPAKVQGSTAAAILVFVAIVGFGVGAIIANTGGGDDPATTENDPNQAAQNDPTEASEQSDSEADPDDTSSEDLSEDDNGSTAGGNGITLTSALDGGEVAAGESGTIDVQAALDSGEEGVTLRVQRSLDGGQNWEGFCDNCTDETSGSGTYTTDFWSGQTGENLFRVVGPDGLASNPIAVTVVEGEDEESD